MKKLKLEIDGNHFQDIGSFYDELNRLTMSNEDWKLGNSLDAFNDLLYGGFGILKGFDELEIIWKNSEKSRSDLGFETTFHFYQNKLKHPEIFNSQYIQQKLDELQLGAGQTYFEILLEIISEHKNISLTLA